MTKRTDAETVKILKSSALTSDAFHTPETKADLDTWIDAQPSEMPTAIALMVGYNYAMRQVQRILSGEL